MGGFNLGIGSRLSSVDAWLQTQAKSFERLSTGKRVNKAADDAAAIALISNSEKISRALAVSERSASSGVSIAQSADGGASQIGALVSRMSELAVQAGNGALSDTDRAALNTEFTALSSEVDRISSSTTYNGNALLSGASSSVQLQVGDGTSSTDQIGISTGNITQASLGLAGLSIDSAANAANAIAALGTASSAVMTRRVELGASVERFSFAGSEITSRRVSSSKALAALEDADMAEEASNAVRSQISIKAALSVKAQASNLSSDLYRALMS